MSFKIKQWVHRLARAGMKARQIHRETGLNTTTVRNILAKSIGDDPALCKPAVVKPVPAPPLALRETYRYKEREPKREFKTSPYAGLFLDKHELTMRRRPVLGACVTAELLGDPSPGRRQINNLS